MHKDTHRLNQNKLADLSLTLIFNVNGLFTLHPFVPFKLTSYQNGF